MGGSYIPGYQDKFVSITDRIPISVCKLDRAHFHKFFKVDSH